MKDVFYENFKKLGGEVSIVDSFEEGATDFRVQLTKLKRKNPDVIFLAGHYKEGALILKQAKELGVVSKFIGGDGCFAPELITLSGGAAEGMMISNMKWNPDSERPVVKSFVSKYRKEYNQDPEAYAAAGYDCLKIVAFAIEQGGTSSSGIKKALYKIANFEGVTGTAISFDEYGELKKAEYDIYIVRNGKFELYK